MSWLSTGALSGSWGAIESRELSSDRLAKPSTVAVITSVGYNRGRLGRAPPPPRGYQGITLPGLIADALAVPREEPAYAVKTRKALERQEAPAAFGLVGLR